MSGSGIALVSLVLSLLILKIVINVLSTFLNSSNTAINFDKRNNVEIKKVEENTLLKTKNKLRNNSIMKQRVIIVGLICEFIACWYVPMDCGWGFGGYSWAWNNIIDRSYCHPDISRIVLEMVSIAILTAIFYLIYDKK